MQLTHYMYMDSNLTIKMNSYHWNFKQQLILNFDKWIFAEQIYSPYGENKTAKFSYFHFFSFQLFRCQPYQIFPLTFVLLLNVLYKRFITIDFYKRLFVSISASSNRFWSRFWSTLYTCVYFLFLLFIVLQLCRHL